MKRNPYKDAPRTMAVVETHFSAQRGGSDTLMATLSSDFSALRGGSETLMSTSSHKRIVQNPVEIVVRVPKPRVVERNASLMKRSPYKNVPCTDLIKLNSYKDVPRPSEDGKLREMKQSLYKNVPWPPESGMLRKTLTRAPAAVAVGRAAVSSGGGGGGRGGGGGPGGRTYVPCHSPKRSRRGSWVNGPVVRQAQWRNADDTISRVGRGCGVGRAKFMKIKI